METLPDQPWTAARFLAWEDQQEGNYEFDGGQIIPVSGSSAAHQVIVFNLLLYLHRLTMSLPLWAVHSMRLQIGSHVRHPDVVIGAEPFDQTIRTLSDAVALFEVLSDDTATKDRVDKLIDHAAVPSLRCYVLLEQAAMAATVFRREPGAVWMASAHTEGALVLPGIDVPVPLADLYRGLTFPPPQQPSAGQPPAG